MVNKIKALRAERKKRIKELLEKKEKIQKDERYSEAYKAEEIGKIDRELQEVRLTLDRQIRQLIEEGKAGARRKAQQAKYDMSEKDLLRQLLVEIQNMSLENRLVAQYADDPDSLRSLASKEVANGSLHAAAYVNALERVATDASYLLTVKQLREQLNGSAVTPAQRQALDELATYEQQEREYQAEIQRESFMSGLGMDLPTDVYKE